MLSIREEGEGRPASDRAQLIAPDGAQISYSAPSDFESYGSIFLSFGRQMASPIPELPCQVSYLLSDVTWKTVRAMSTKSPCSRGVH